MELRTEQLEEMYVAMLRIRAFEEGVIALSPNAERFPIMTRGTEAVAAGVCSGLEPDDYLLSNHKPTAHLIARGANLDRMMAELFGKATGYCGGKGGRMELADLDLNIIGGTGIVGANIPIACGVGHTCQVRYPGRIGVCFLGDGATTTGAFHEGVGLAAVWGLPIVFVIENNQYGAYLPVSEQTNLSDLSELARAYGIPGVTIDGNDAAAVAGVALAAFERARSNEGPTLIEAVTYVAGGGTTTAGGVEWRSEEEVESWKARDPINLVRRRLIADAVLTETQDADLRGGVEKEIELATAFMQESPSPDPDNATRDIFFEGPGKTKPEPIAPPIPEGLREITYQEAVREALHEEMTRDSSVFLVGEHVTVPALEACRKGLLEEFGPDRLKYTPIAEMAIIGTALGGSLTGMRPVAEIATINFTTCCMDLIVNHVAKYRYGKARGDLSLPLVIRTVSGSTGPNFGAGPSHEQSLEALFTHIPGLQVVVPSTPYDVKGFLKSCIQGDDPVLFIEHRSLYGLAGPVPDEEYVLPLGKARIARSGDDLTIVAWSQAVHMALEAAHEVEQKGISVEVVDLRSLRPLDMDTVLDSVRRTGRLMVVHEACRTGGFGAEIVAIVAEAAFGQLLAPIKRVTSLDSPIPVSREQMKRVIVDVEKIIDGVVDLMAPEAALSN